MEQFKPAHYSICWSLVSVDQKFDGWFRTQKGGDRLTGTCNVHWGSKGVVGSVNQVYWEAVTLDMFLPVLCDCLDGTDLEESFDGENLTTPLSRGVEVDVHDLSYVVKVEMRVGGGAQNTRHLLKELNKE